MAVLVIANGGQSNKEEAERWDKLLRDVLPKEPGFIVHADGAQPDGTHRIVELWESREQFDAHFEKMLRPNLPPDADPEGNTEYIDLPNVIR